MELSQLGTIIRERRESLGLTQSRLAQMSGVSRQTLVGLEAGALSDLGFNRVSQVLAVLGLDLDPPSQAARSRKRGLWMAAKNASVSYAEEVPPDTLGHALVSGSVPKGYAAHLTHLLDERAAATGGVGGGRSRREGGRRAQGGVAQRREACQVTRRAPAGPVGLKGVTTA